VWTFDVPPLDYERNGYFSVIKYDGMGWLDVDRPGLSGSELVRNDVLAQRTPRSIDPTS
jgi:hypothetical protein